MPSNNNTHEALVKVANLFRNTMFMMIDNKNLPKKIKRATSIGQVQSNANRSAIDITIKGKDVVGAAWAFELGSGLHGDKGQKYPITPKKSGGILTFMWPEAQNIEPGRPPGTRAKKVVDDTGRAFLPGVMHPGVKAKPFIRPSIDQTFPETKKILAKAFKADLLEGVPRVTVIVG